jgi:hypothetical protein
VHQDQDLEANELNSAGNAQEDTPDQDTSLFTSVEASPINPSENNTAEKVGEQPLF